MLLKILSIFCGVLRIFSSLLGIFFLPGFSFTNNVYLQNSREKEGTIFISLFLSTTSTRREHSDIYLQLCMWGRYHVFLIAHLLTTRLLLDDGMTEFYRFASTITLALQANWQTKCASHPSNIFPNTCNIFPNISKNSTWNIFPSICKNTTSDFISIKPLTLLQSLQTQWTRQRIFAIKP